MYNRRKFLENLSLAGIGLPLASIYVPSGLNLPKAAPNSDIDWEKIRNDFHASTHDLINLNNGSSSNMPIPILKAYTHWTTEFNSFAPYYVLNKNKASIEQNLQRLAQEIGADSGEIAIVRNTTEAINIILWGLDLSKGDEIITASWDYPLAEYTYNRLVEKKSVIIRTIPDFLHTMDDDSIVNAYENMITDKTKLIHLTWMTHREGQILPARRICEMAHAHGVQVIVDGAHIAGHIECNLNSIGCDYFASSLHKWMNAPLGTGLMFIRQEIMPEHTPEISYGDNLKNPHKRYDYLGTRAYQNLTTLSDVLDYLDITGIKAKQERFHMLASRWVNALSSVEGIQLYTQADKYCGVATLGIKNLSSGKIVKMMKEDFGIHVKPTGYKKMPMIRISPNMYTSVEEIDRFIDAATQIARKN